MAGMTLLLSNLTVPLLRSRKKTMAVGRVLYEEEGNKGESLQHACPKKLQLLCTRSRD